MSLNRRDFLRTGTILAGAPALTGWSHLAHAETPAKPKKPGPYDDAILKAGPPPLPEEGAFTIAVLPDTQGYSMLVPDLYVAQTEWIVKHKDDRNIACVLHLGDITNNNTHDQWKNARAAMEILDGQVPYFMTLGNHDYGENGHTHDRTTHFHEYFPREKYSQLPHFAGSYDKEPDRFDNNYHFFTAGGRDFLVLSLEFGPRKDVIRWANEVVGAHPDKSVILITHAFIYFDDTRYNWKKYGAAQKWNPHAYPIARATNDDVHDGEELWDLLISRHDNFIMTLNGHVCGDGIGRMSSHLPSGKEVHQILVNFQVKPKYGDGWLRLLEFRNDRETVMAYDYSPTLDQCNVAPDNTFEIKIPS